MRAKLIGKNLISITRNGGRPIGELVLQADVGQGIIDRLLEVLNDKPGVKSGELREAAKPLCLEMVAQRIDAIQINRIEHQFITKLWKEGAKEWETTE